VYNIVCDSLGVDPLPGNGTLRLPLKPVGLHSDENAPVLDTPPDPPAPTSTAVPPQSTSPQPSAPQPTLPQSKPPQLVQPAPKPTAPPAKAPPTPDHDEDKEKDSTWWEKISHKFDDLKDWASGVADAVQGKHPQTES
jgi:hypothetical protein